MKSLLTIAIVCASASAAFAQESPRKKQAPEELASAEEPPPTKETASAEQAPASETPEPPAQDPNAPKLSFETKVLWNVFDDYGDNETFENVATLPIGIARLIGTSGLGKHLSIDTHLVFEFAAINDVPELIDLFNTLGASAILNRAPNALPLQKDIDFDGSSGIRALARVDRLALKATHPLGSVTVGRQPIGLGIGVSIFPIMDRMVPLPVTAPDREYRAGIDAVRTDWTLSPKANLALAYAFGGDWQADEGDAFGYSKARAAAVVDYQLNPASKFSAMASVLREMPFFGAGYHMALRPTWTVYTEAGLAVEDTPVDDRPAAGFATVGTSVTPLAGLNLTAEVFYNGFGSTDPDDYPTILTHPRVQTQDLPFFFGMYHVGLMGSYAISDVFSTSLLSMISPFDKSALFIATAGAKNGESSAIMVTVWAPVGVRPDETLVPNSEYGLTLPSLLVDVRLYF